MARGLFVLMLVLCTILATPSRVGGASSQSTLIVPGIQIGPVRIGMLPSEVVRIFGQPTEMHTASPGVWNMGWARHSVSVVFLNAYPHGEVWRIVTLSSRFATKQGVRVGLTVADVLKRLGPPVDSPFEAYGAGMLKYPGLSLQYAVRSGRVDAVVVTALSMPP